MYLMNRGNNPIYDHKSGRFTAVSVNRFPKQSNKATFIPQEIIKPAQGKPEKHGRQRLDSHIPSEMRDSKSEADHNSKLKEMLPRKARFTSQDVHRQNSPILITATTSRDLNNRMEKERLRMEEMAEFSKKEAKKKQKLIDALKRMQDERRHKIQQMLKIKEKRRSVFEKYKNEEKNRDNVTYKTYRKELVMSEKRMHDRSLEIKKKNIEDFLSYQSRFRSTMTQSFRQNDDDYIPNMKTEIKETSLNNTPEKSHNNSTMRFRTELLQPIPINEKSLIKNYNKLMTIQQKTLKKYKALKKIAEKVKQERIHKFETVSNNIKVINKEFDNFRKTKIKKFKDKERSLEEQRSIAEHELLKRKKLNLFRYLDHKENLKREKTFYKKFVDRIMTKHVNISQRILTQKEKERTIQEIRRKNEDIIRTQGSPNIRNWVDSYYDVSYNQHS